MTTLADYLASIRRSLESIEASGDPNAEPDRETARRLRQIDYLAAQAAQLAGVERSEAVS